jgi:mycofactocin system creatininase family protein
VTRHPTAVSARRPTDAAAGVPTGAPAAADPGTAGPDQELAAMAWTEVAPLAAHRLLAVPVGATEQHGPHLPLGTDTIIATALAARLASARPDVWLAPAVAFGSSGEHAAFTGTLSIGQQALELVVTELVRSADAFAGVVIVSGHGGNAVPLARAATTLVAEGRRVTVWSPGSPAGGDAHAGRTETSVLLALDPAAVRLDAAEAGDRRPLAELLPLLESSGVAAVSPNGVLGDPVGATAAEGAVLLDAWAADLLDWVSAWEAAA